MAAMRIVAEKNTIDIKTADEVSTPYIASNPAKVNSLIPKLAIEIGSLDKIYIVAAVQTSTGIGTAICAVLAERMNKVTLPARLTKIVAIVIARWNL